jgi:hypothetical protein
MQEILPKYKTNMSSTTTTVTVNSLLPGMAYRCEGVIKYHNYESLWFPSKEVQTKTKKLDFNVTSKAFKIDIKFDNLRNWNLKIFYKNVFKSNVLQFVETNTSESELTIENLEMSTNYLVCLALETDSGCPKNVIECQKCDTVQTIEAIPFPPSNVHITEETEKKLKVSWNKPEKQSGKISAYIILLEGQCIVSGECGCEETKPENKSVGANIFSHIFDAKPYLSYKVSVFAKNSQGAGNSYTASVTTKSEFHHPTVELKPQSKSITVTLNLTCPYTGPVTYVVEVKAENKLINSTKITFSHEKSMILRQTQNFENLTPAKNYSICTSVPDTLPAICNFIVTNQIPPEGHPSLKIKTQNETTIHIDVRRPNNAYPSKGELLIYHFKMTSKCQYSDDRCSLSQCNEIYNWTTRSSRLSNFEFFLNDLKPYWMYRFQTVLENKAGNGPLSNSTDWYNTTEITDNFMMLPATITTTSSDTKISVHINPGCPYIGNILRSFFFKFHILFSRIHKH